MKETILVLDDQENIRNDLKRHLDDNGYFTYTASNINQVKEIISIKKIDYAIIDLKIDYKSEYGGINAIVEINRIQPKTRVIILSAYEPEGEITKHLNLVEYFGYVSKGGETNYIEAVLEELSKAQNISLKKKCFVIMPFSDTKKCTAKQWEEIYENMIKPSVEKSGYDYVCYKTNLSIGNIIKDILDNLNRSDVVIADLTDRNPNVYYELGVRHALRDSTILISQSLDDVPFDLRHYALILYEWTTKKDKNEFKRKIKAALKDVENNEINTLSPVREYLKITI